MNQIRGELRELSKLSPQFAFNSPEGSLVIDRYPVDTK